MATVQDTVRDLRARERALPKGTTRSNLKNIRKGIERYSPGSTCVAGGTLNLAGTYWLTWELAPRTVSWNAGTVTVSS